MRAKFNLTLNSETAHMVISTINTLSTVYFSVCDDCAQFRVAQR
ncbi:hypothetical protein AAKU64_000660 [Undibacterium sp. GrIS 1.8]